MKYQIPKLFVGPVSKNTVDSVIEYSNEHDVPLGLIPSRRQIDWNGGYVNGWNTETFCEYVRAKTKNVIIQRDHGGSNQGILDDDGERSFLEDNVFMDIIHIDPWKLNINFDDGIRETIHWLNRLDNPNVKFEIGTEQSIRKMDIELAERFLKRVAKSTPGRIFSKIQYFVIQSGTSLMENSQTGTYCPDTLLDFVALSRKNLLYTKEHNGDYISSKEIRNKFKLGLDSINLAPEFGMIETSCILKELDEEGEEDLLNHFYSICYKSDTWRKWIGKDFDVNDKERLIKICGHYLFSTPGFEKIKYNMRDLDKEIKFKMKERIHEIVKQ